MDSRLVATAVATVAAVILLLVRRGVVRAIPAQQVRARFWFDQVTRIAITVALIVAVAAIWGEGTARFASMAAFITAGLTIALQKVVTSFAGYLSILRGEVFTVGDRITMGGVRGDVVALSYLRTTVMEMGQPATADSDAPAMWVAGRQYTGRIVTITNDKIFETPVYNYTREFPYLWDEIHIPIHYGDDWQRAEKILLDAARAATSGLMPAAKEALKALLVSYVALEPPEIEPRVYLRLTDNWIELTLRFLAREHGVRDVKNRISRQILQELSAAGIGVASATLEIVKVPPISIRDRR